MPTLIETVEETRAAAKAAIDAAEALTVEVLKAPTADKRDLNEDETARFEAAFAEREKAMGDYRTADDRLKDLRETEERERSNAAAAVRVGDGVRSEPLTYRRGGEFSYFRDLAMQKSQRGGDLAGATDRLARHGAEMDVELPAREARREARAREEMHSMGIYDSPFERRVNPNRTDGQGGYLVPPIWLMDEFVTLARAGRVFANSVRQLTLPAGTDSINVPKMLTGTATAIQTADAAPVTSTDFTDTSVSAGVKTIAGQQDISLQLLEQSPLGVDDQVIFPDLLADYNQKLDLQTLMGSGSAGQVQGVNGLSGTNGITYTDATPTGPELYLPLAQSISQVATGRLLPPTAVFMHPRRWYWLASQLDTTNRPLVVPADQGPFNPEALQTGIVAEGPVGRVLGLPILLDANIPTTQGAGTNEDRVYTLRTNELLLWEGNLRTRALMEVLSGTLQVRLQVYNYLAFMPDRYPKAISVVSGTGLVAPAGF